jgi:replicative DNA helicase
MCEVSVESRLNEGEMTAAKITDYIRIFTSNDYNKWFENAEKEHQILDQLQTQLMDIIARHRRGEIDQHGMNSQLYDFVQQLDKLDNDKAACEHLQRMLVKLDKSVKLEQQGFVVIGGDQDMFYRETLMPEVYVLAYVDSSSEE